MNADFEKNLVMNAADLRSSAFTCGKDLFFPGLRVSLGRFSALLVPSLRGEFKGKNVSQPSFPIRNQQTTAIASFRQLVLAILRCQER